MDQDEVKAQGESTPPGAVRLEGKRLTLSFFAFTIAIIAMVALLIWVFILSERTQRYASRADFADGMAVVYVDLEDKLYELGATDVDMEVDDGISNHIYFKIAGVDAGLTFIREEMQYKPVCDHVGETVLVFFPENAGLQTCDGAICEGINSFLEMNDTDASVKYYDKKRGMYITDTMIRCIDYVGFRGEYYQQKSGRHHAIYDDIGIWLEGVEPPDYDYDK